ncbi:MAG: cob(I)yrinic acid a,c-diamide adenosyltransferase [Proteobacteria bacterium]|jgi:cob(I)alamin adenosyltransferase|nr:cob(I)yrinic acid a,c-diamide adenosyltransferase [Pseudomonadota bacterium]
MTPRIYTRTGDSGTTSLADGARVGKDEPRIAAYGAIDEANAFVGAARAFSDDPRLDELLSFLQHRLYNCSSNVACSSPANAATSVSDDDVAAVERAIDELEERSGAIRGFVLPGGGRAAALLHAARTVCRRAELSLWALAEEEEVSENVLKFVNRASDLLFAAARCSNHAEGPGDVLWDKDAPFPS